MVTRKGSALAEQLADESQTIDERLTDDYVKVIEVLELERVAYCKVAISHIIASVEPKRTKKESFVERTWSAACVREFGWTNHQFREMLF